MQWVKLWRYCVENHDSPTAVMRRLSRGIWAEGRHVVKRDGQVWVNLAEALSWLKRERRATHLYVIGEHGAERPVKIGIADDLAKRIVGLQTGNPRKLEIRASFTFDSPKLARDAERAVQDHFRPYALCGEWLNVSDREAADWITATYTPRGQIRHSDRSKKLVENA